MERNLRRILGIFVALLMLVTTTLIAVTPAWAAINVAPDVTVPLTTTNLTKAHVKPGVAVPVTFTVTAGAAAAGEVQISVGAATTAYPVTFTGGVDTFTYEGTASATPGTYDVVVGARQPAGSGAWTSSTTAAAVGAVIVDSTAPTLTSIAWTDQDSSTNINAGDKLAFTFSEAMDSSTIANANVDGTGASRLPLSAGVYGAGSTVSWDGTKTIATVTLGAPTFVSGATVNPAAAVTDLAGNADATAGAGVAILDNVSPKLLTVAYTDTDSSQTVTGGDRLVYTFSEPMNTGTVTASNINTSMPVSAHSYGTTSAGLSVSWNGAGTVLTVILGTDTTIAYGDTINPAASVTDVAGNPDATPAALAIFSSPYLVSILWTDTNNSGTINATDTLKFTFSEAMDNTTITDGTLDTDLAATGGHSYGATASGVWNGVKTQLTVTLGGGGLNIAVGDTVNPAGTVKSANGVADNTVTPPAVTANIKLNSIVLNETNSDGTPDAGETLVFTFNTAMDTSTITSANVATVLAPSAGTYGTSPSVAWTGNTILTLTLGTAPTVAAGATVNPTNAVHDASGNSDQTTNAGKPPINARPWLVSIGLTDVNGDKAIDSGDQLTFTFNENMKAGVITLANVATMLPLSGGHTYNASAFTDFNGGNAICVVTLGANTTVASGDTVNPADAVVDQVTGTGAGADQTLAPGIAITDSLAPLLNSIALVDTNQNGSVDAGDKVIFTFSEPMNTGTVTAQNVNSVLASNGNHPFDYGTIASTMSLSWTSSKVLTITLGSNGTIAVGNTVTPAASVTDAIGNAYAAGAITVHSAPYLISAVWTDTNNDGRMDNTDTILFTFSEAMKAGVITQANVDTMLPTSSAHSYNASGFADFGGTTATVTLGAAATVLQGETINPALTVVANAAGNTGDATQGTGPSLRNDTNAAPVAPTILTVVGTAVNNGNDTIAIKFSENVTGAATAANWTVTHGVLGTETAVALTNLMLGYNDAVPGAPAQLTITLNEPTQYLVNGDLVKVTPAAGSITDVGGNAVASAVYTSAGTTNDATPPTFSTVATAVSGAADTIVLTFSEYVQPIAGKTWALPGNANSVFSTIDSPTGSALSLTGATISPSDSSATKTVTITLGQDNLQYGATYTVTLNNNQVADLGSNLITGGPLSQAGTVAGDATNPTFTIGYYSDSGLTTVVSNNYLKAGTYYIKITANEQLKAAPTISINAEGAANDVTNAATTLVSGNIYSYTHVILNDPAATGIVSEAITISGTDLAGNAAVGVAVTGAKWTDTVIPTSVTVNYPNGGESLSSGQAKSITWTATDTRTPSANLVIALKLYDGSSWSTIATGLANTGVYSWTVPSISTSNALISVEASDEAGNTASDASNNVFSITTAGSPITSIDLKTGWNMVSLMRIPTSSAIGTVLTGVTVTSVNAYDATSKQWTSYTPGAPSDLTTMVDGKGYWINMPANATLAVPGVDLPTPPATPPTYNVVVGWNLIGFKSTTAKTATQYLSALGSGYTMIYGFDATTQTYFAVQGSDNLNPGHGYWLAATSAGTIYP